MLAAHPNLTDAELAEALNMHPKTCEGVRWQLVQGGTIVESGEGKPKRWRLAPIETPGWPVTAPSLPVRALVMASVVVRDEAEHVEVEMHDDGELIAVWFEAGSRWECEQCGKRICKHVHAAIKRLELGRPGVRR